MISAALFLSTLALSAFVNADVSPTEPGPNTVFKQGQTCRTVWTGDKDGKWGGMAIELMTGNDLQMVHLTTLAEDLDGNKDGQLEFECPEVDPYSAIYFFQYSAPGATGFQWATRFTIADKDGKSVPPPEDTQPNGKKVGWGVGKLVDASAAKPPPTFQTQAGGGATNTTTTTTSDQPTNTVSNTRSGLTTAKPTTGLTGTGGSNANLNPTGGSGSSGSGSGSSGSGSGNNKGNGTASNANNNGTAGGNGNNGAVGVAFSAIPLQVTFAVVTVSGFASLFL